MKNNVQISKAKVLDFEGNYWNSFNDILAMSDPTELSGLLYDCHLAYWYASEVANGGHFQYFDNQSQIDFDEAVESLTKTGANKAANILRSALAIGSETDSEEEDALMLELDNQLYDVDLFKHLEQFLKEHEKEIVTWVE